MYRLSGGFFDREEETVDVRRSVFLSVEGVRSEPSYFRALDRWLKENRRGDVQIYVLKHPNDGLSSPTDVYDLLEECRALREEERFLPESAVDELKQRFTDEEITELVNGASALPEERRREFFDTLLKMGINLSYRKFLKDANSSDGDLFAVVIDRDVESHSREELNKIVEKCREKSFLCCLTNPNFEFWLLLHLVDVEELLKPEERERILRNKKETNKHTYISKWVSKMAGHAKRIPWPKFKTHYGPNLDKAREAAKSFAGSNEKILDQVGTMMPVLLEKLELQVSRESRASLSMPGD